VDGRGHGEALLYGTRRSGRAGKTLDGPVGVPGTAVGPSSPAISTSRSAVGDPFRQNKDTGCRGERGLVEGPWGQPAAWCREDRTRWAPSRRSAAGARRRPAPVDVAAP